MVMALPNTHPALWDLRNAQSYIEIPQPSMEKRSLQLMCRCCGQSRWYIHATEPVHRRPMPIFRISSPMWDQEQEYSHTGLLGNNNRDMNDPGHGTRPPPRTDLDTDKHVATGSVAGNNNTGALPSQVNQPYLIDSASSQTFKDIANNGVKGVLMVSHDPRHKLYFDHVLEMTDGKLLEK